MKKYAYEAYFSLAQNKFLVKQKLNLPAIIILTLKILRF